MSFYGTIDSNLIRFDVFKLSKLWECGLLQLLLELGALRFEIREVGLGTCSSQIRYQPRQVFQIRYKPRQLLTSKYSSRELYLPPSAPANHRLSV